MNSRTALLRETAAWMDTVDLGLCMFIYGVCNEYQFNYVSGSDFVNFMNLKPTARDVSVRPKENLRVCYMVLGRLWAEEFLKRCGISKTYYDKHRSDVCAQGATDANRKYRKDIDKAVENARRLGFAP